MHRIHSLDYLKFLLAAGVVLAHSLLIDLHLVTWSYLLGAGVLRSLVPTFSVLSGYCFFVTRSRRKARRWLGGLVLLYLFWAAFYAPIWFDRDMTAGDLLQALLLGPMHLWYVAGLALSIGLLLLFLSLGERTGTGLLPLLLAAAICALTGSVLAFWSFFSGDRLPEDVLRNGATVIFPYVAVGYALASWVRERGMAALPPLRALWLAVAGLFALRLVVAGLGLWRYGLSLNVPPELPILAWPTAIMLFMAVLRLDLPEAPVDLSLWSASVYFLHIFLILLIRHFGSESVTAYVLLGVIGPILIATGLRRVVLRLAPVLRARRLSRQQ